MLNGQQRRYHRDPRGYGGREKRAGLNPRFDGLMDEVVALLELVLLDRGECCSNWCRAALLSDPTAEKVGRSG